MSLTGREARYFESLGRLFEQGRIRKDKTMYKDKDRQRQAVREAVRKHRAKRKPEQVVIDAGDIVQFFGSSQIPTTGSSAGQKKG